MRTYGILGLIGTFIKLIGWLTVIVTVLSSCGVLITGLAGTFTLRSGAVSNEYFDKYRFESDPALLRRIGEAMAPLVPVGTEVLAGLELGGVPLATILAQVTGLPACFVRKEAKSYGTCQLAEGLDLAGRQVTVVEDVVTSGGQVVISSQHAAGSQTDGGRLESGRWWVSGAVGSVEADDGVEVHEPAALVLGDLYVGGPDELAQLLLRDPEPPRELAREVDRGAAPQLTEQVVPDHCALVVKAFTAQRLTQLRILLGE